MERFTTKLATTVGCLDRTIRFCETYSGLLRGTLLEDGKQLIAISGEGQYKAAPELETALIYVVQADLTQNTYELKAFAVKFGWRNNPAMVKLTGN